MVNLGVKSTVCGMLVVVLLLAGPVNACLQVYSVMAGFPVTYSTRHHNHDTSIFRLNVGGYAWSAQVNNANQWVQISSINVEKWIAVITQGRPNANQWVTQYQVQYSLNGRNWKCVDGCSRFTGNSNRNSWKKNTFKTPVYARSIRIKPKKWNNHVSMRFDGIFERL